MNLNDSSVPLITDLESRDEIPRLDFVILLLEDFERKHESEFSGTGSDSALFLHDR